MVNNLQLPLQMENSSSICVISFIKEDTIPCSFWKWNYLGLPVKAVLRKQNRGIYVNLESCFAKFSYIFLLQWPNAL